VTLNLAETSVVNSRPSLPHGANLSSSDLYISSALMDIFKVGLVCSWTKICHGYFYRPDAVPCIQPTASNENWKQSYPRASSFTTLPHASRNSLASICLSHWHTHRDSHAMRPLYISAWQKGGPTH